MQGCIQHSLLFPLDISRMRGGSPENSDNIRPLKTKKKKKVVNMELEMLAETEDEHNLDQQQASTF